MSKTTKTRPVAVRMADRRDHKVGLVEVHHHEHGPCTLPPLGPNPKRTTNGCFYQDAYRGVDVCGCTVCTAQEERRQERRRSRHMIRTKLRRIVTVGDVQEAADDFGG